MGGRYYDPKALAAQSALAAQMADPSKGLLDPKSPHYYDTAPNADGSGAQRGDTQKDSYMSLEVTVGYIFKKST